MQNRGSTSCNKILSKLFGGILQGMCYFSSKIDCYKKPCIKNNLADKEYEISVVNLKLFHQEKELLM